MCQLGIKAYVASRYIVYQPTRIQASICAVTRYPTQQELLTIPTMAQEAAINRKCPPSWTEK